MFSIQLRYGLLQSIYSYKLLVRETIRYLLFLAVLINQDSVVLNIYATSVNNCVLSNIWGCTHSTPYIHDMKHVYSFEWLTIGRGPILYFWLPFNFRPHVQIVNDVRIKSYQNFIYRCWQCVLAKVTLVCCTPWPQRLWPALQWSCCMAVLLQMSSILFLERCMNILLRQRTEKLVKRRQEDIKDESVLYMAGGQNYMLVWGGKQLAIQKYNMDR